MRKYIISLILYMFISCDEKPSPLADYLSHVHNCTNPRQFSILVFLPQNSCSSCLTKIITFLNSQETMPIHMGIVISGYSRPDILAITNALKNKRNPLLIDVKYQYLQYGLFEASTAFWLEQNTDGSIQIYPLESSRLAVNLLQLRKTMEMLDQSYNGGGDSAQFTVL